MINTLIIYSHPSKKSYTFQVLEQLTQILNNQNFKVEVSDLYAMNFLSDMTEQEYEREGFANIQLPIPKDVIEEHKKIGEADCIIFLYPVWWSDCPAKLKGWFDRVFSVGYAYGQRPELPKMKTFKCGAVICTAGHPNNFLKEIGIEQSMQNIMLDDRLGKRFENKDMLILGGTLDIENVRQTHIKQIERLVNKINQYFADA